jgi:hypothetical protein
MLLYILSFYDSDKRQIGYVMSKIEGLTPADEFRIGLEGVKESLKPSRCPRCKSTDIRKVSCSEGSVCGYDCGGGGVTIFCGSCSHTINESECEEAEER